MVDADVVGEETVVIVIVLVSDGVLVVFVRIDRASVVALP